MNNSIYTDKQLIALAKKEYEPYDIGDWVFINGGNPIIGHVSEVNHKA